MSIISKTTFTFTVIHRTDEPFIDGLLEAMARSNDGHAVGQETGEVTVPVLAQKVEEELVLVGNDGTFFDDDISEEIRASQLEEHDLFQEDSYDPWREVAVLDQHGDTLLITDTEGDETTFDIDTVIYRQMKETA